MGYGRRLVPSTEKEWGLETEHKVALKTSQRVPCWLHWKEKAETLLEMKALRHGMAGRAVYYVTDWSPRKFLFNPSAKGNTE